MRLISCVGAMVIALGLGVHSAPAETASAETVSVKMVNAEGAEVGEATLTDTPHGVLIKLDLSQGESGTHAFHIHEVGKCEPPFQSAGGHFNPSDKKHGFLDADGNHVGDLPNIHVPDSGKLMVEVLATEASLKEGENKLFDDDGSALVIHAKADDYRTDPAGDAGDRIACGVIAEASKEDSAETEEKTEDED